MYMYQFITWRCIVSVEQKALNRKRIPWIHSNKDFLTSKCPCKSRFIGTPVWTSIFAALFRFQLVEVSLFIEPISYLCVTLWLIWLHGVWPMTSPPTWQRPIHQWTNVWYAVVFVTLAGRQVSVTRRNGSAYRCSYVYLHWTTWSIGVLFSCKKKLAVKQTLFVSLFLLAGTGLGWFFICSSRARARSCLRACHNQWLATIYSYHIAITSRWFTVLMMFFLQFSSVLDAERGRVLLWTRKGFSAL